jgi:hypothetical protein
MAKRGAKNRAAPGGPEREGRDRDQALREAAASLPSDREAAAAEPAPFEGRPDIPGWGVDLDPKNRPGVPIEREPRPAGEAHWDQPERQEPRLPHLVRMELGQLTPVFGTAQPPSGLSGLIRRAAYRIPEHEARRWLLLLLADRLEAYAARLGLPSLVGPVHGSAPVGARVAGFAREQPAAAAALALGLGALAGALVGAIRRGGARLDPPGYGLRPTGPRASSRRWAELPGV